MSIKDITIVITTFKSEEKIRNCLNSIDNRCRVIIVENSNNYEFKKNIEKEFINVECILTGANLGYGKANNIGLKKVLSKYALILNPDTTLHLSTLENFLQTTKNIPEFAIMGPYTQEEKNKDNKDYLTIINPTQVVNVKGFAMFLNLSEFNEIGFFDENFFLYFEDTDLCKRLKKKGKKFYVLSNIKIHHAFGTTPQKKYRNRLTLIRNWHLYWSSFYYHRKHYGFLKSFTVHLSKLIRFSIMKNIYFLLNKKKLYYLLNARSKGLMCQILDKSAFSGPKIN